MFPLQGAQVQSQVGILRYCKPCGMVPPPQINFFNIIENLLIEQQAVYLLFQLSFSITVCVQIVYKQIGFAWGGGKKNDILMSDSLPTSLPILTIGTSP